MTKHARSTLFPIYREERLITAIEGKQKRVSICARGGTHQLGVLPEQPKI